MADRNPAVDLRLVTGSSRRHHFLLLDRYWLPAKQRVIYNKKLSWYWQTRATRLDVSQGQQTLWPFHMLGIVYSCAIVTLSSRRAIFPIFDFKNLEIRFRGHSSGTIQSIVYGFLLVFFSNFVPKMHRF